ncbi:MAG: hypothetical protein FWB86_11820, partial [Treponema sp.]|nr:hypothetical protein [Treponema sp.]
MNIFDKLLPNRKRIKIQPQAKQKTLLENSDTLLNYWSEDDDFIKFSSNSVIGETYLLHAWVNIAVNILIRNIARADFTIKREGNDI